MSVGIADPRGMVQRYHTRRALSLLPIAQIQEQLDIVRQRLDILFTIRERMHSKEYQWLIREYLPNERRRIMNERNQLPPGDTVKQAMAQGQINQVDKLLEDLHTLDVEINIAKESLDMYLKAETECLKKTNRSER